MVKRRWSVVLERTVRELQGTDCMGLEHEPPAKQEIAWHSEVHQYRVAMAAKRVHFTLSLFSVVTAHQFPLAIKWTPDLRQ